MTITDRFWRKVEVTDDCWNWIGALTSRGYGSLGFNTQPWLAHRFAYTHLVGPIPDGLTVDHTCFNTRCVKPGHLEVVSLQENVRRAHARVTHCKSGHELVRKEGDRQRRCRTCENEARQAERVAA